jgi:hypothetical protein
MFEDCRTADIQENEDADTLVIEEVNKHVNNLANCYLPVAADRTSALASDIQRHFRSVLRAARPCKKARRAARSATNGYTLGTPSVLIYRNAPGFSLNSGATRCVSDIEVDNPAPCNARTRELPKH